MKKLSILLSTVFLLCCNTFAQEQSKVFLKPLNEGVSGVVNFDAQDGLLELNVFGLSPNHNYTLKIGGKIVDTRQLTTDGVLTLSGFFSKEEVVTGVAIYQEDGQKVAIVSGLDFKLADISVESGKTLLVPISIRDPDGELLTFSVACSRGNFVSISDRNILIAPKDSDVGTLSCRLTATDSRGLLSNSDFAITVTASNKPPTISTLLNQSIKAGEKKEIEVDASDPNNDLLGFALIAAPSFVTLTEQGNGRATIRIAPGLIEISGGRVVVQVVDGGGLIAQSTFQIDVQPAVAIFEIARTRKNLFISGIGFGISTKVSINGRDVTSSIIGQSSSSITLKGSNRKLNLILGRNQVEVLLGGTRAIFVLNL
ncbi:MAG: hypothetical protein JNN15_14270 [Blastocatellia bacterium]|nr:hypothetical protein [Blastocatellia bacterium]